MAERRWVLEGVDGGIARVVSGPELPLPQFTDGPIEVIPASRITQLEEALRAIREAAELNNCGSANGWILEVTALLAEEVDDG